MTHIDLEGIDVVVFPAVNYRRETLMGGQAAIIFPVFIAGGIVRIQYLAVNRLTENIHIGVFSDEGAAKHRNVALVFVQSLVERAWRGGLQWAGAAALTIVSFKGIVFAWHALATWLTAK